MALWSLAVAHAVWIKNCVFTRSLEPSNSPFHVYFGKKPNISSVHLFGCKAYLHVLKINQSKLSEHSIECVHVSFAPEKSAYMLYNREQRRCKHGQVPTQHKCPPQRGYRSVEGVWAHGLANKDLLSYLDFSRIFHKP